MKQAGPLLGMGYLCAALGAGLSPFVMIGLLGLMILGAAFGLLLSAGSIANTPSLPWYQKISGFVLFLAGVLGLLISANYATNMAFNQVQGSRPGMTVPTPTDWIVVGLAPILPTLLITLGLRLRARWPWNHCLIWGAVAIAVQPVALVVFWLLAPFLPLTA